MDYELYWDNEVVTDNDETIARLEAEITESKALLAQLSAGDDIF
jgi:hypothetical protein